MADHIFHVIWPAFMLIGIAAAAKRATKQFIERIVMVACDPELMFLADDLLPRGKPPVRTAGSAWQSRTKELPIAPVLRGEGDGG